MIMRSRQLFNLKVLIRKFNSLLRLIMFSIVTTMSLTLPVMAAVLEGDINLFQLTAMSQKNNTERIDTWQGGAQVETIREHSDGFMQREKSLYDFLFSIKQDATRWKWTGQERYIREKFNEEEISKHWENDWASEMRKDDAFYKYDQGDKSNDLVIWPREKAEDGLYSYSFDPMWYLKGPMTLAPAPNDLAGMLMFYHRKVNDPNFAPDNIFKIHRNENLVVLEILYFDIVNRYTFDLSKGGSIVEYYGDDKASSQLREWTYEKKDEVWIPKTFTHKNTRKTPSPDGLIQKILKVTFIENTLNHPVPSSEFTLEKLGVTIGDRVSDHKTGLFYIYGGGEKRLIDEDLNMLLKENQRLEVTSKVQDTAVSEEKHINNELLVQNDVKSEHLVLNQIEQTQRLNHTKFSFFVIALLTLVILAMVSFVWLRKNN